MKKLLAVLGTGALLVSLGICTSQAGAAESVRLKIATLAPEGSNQLKIFHAMNDEVKQRTGNLVEFKVYTGGTMGTGADILRKMDTNQLQGGAFMAGEAAAVYMDLRIPSIPLLFRDYDEIDAVMEKILPLFEKALADKGYVALTWLETGFVYIMSTGSPIGSVGDLKGHKIWIPEDDPVGTTTFEMAGVPPIPLSLADVLTGLQTGLIDTAITTPSGAILLQWHSKVKNVTNVPLLYTYGLVMLKKDAFEKIPAEHREAVKEIARRHFAEMKIQTRKDNEAAIETLKKNNIVFVDVTPEHYKEFVVLIDRVKEKLGQQVFTKETLQTVQNAIAEYRKAHAGPKQRK